MLLCISSYSQAEKFNLILSVQKIKQNEKTCINKNRTIFIIHAASVLSPTNICQTPPRVSLLYFLFQSTHIPHPTHLSVTPTFQQLLSVDKLSTFLNDHFTRRFPQWLFQSKILLERKNVGSAIHPAVCVCGFPSKFWASWPDSNKTSYKFYIIRKHPNVLVFLVLNQR